MNPSGISPPKPIANIKTGKKTEKLLAGLCLSISVYFIGCFLFVIFTNYWPGPYIDYWIDISNIQKYFNHTLSWQDLISAHANVHRLLLPRLLFIADYRFFAGTNILLISISLLCKVVTLWLFYQFIKEQPTTIKLLLLTLTVMAAFGSGNLSNVLHNSNMQWDMVTIFSLLSIYCYAEALNNPTRTQWQYLFLAFLFFMAGFFSQAGAIPVLFVIMIIAGVRRKWGHLVFNTAFMLTTLYLTFYILPVNEPEKATYEEAAGIFVMKTYYVAVYVFKFMSHSMAQFLGNYGLYFSGYILLLFIAGIWLSKKTSEVYSNKLLHFSTFLIFMMISIASLRVDFLPNTWWATRYQITSAVLVLCLTLHHVMAAPLLLSAHSKRTIFLQAIYIIHAMIIFFLAHYFSYNNGYGLSNRVFKAQAYLLTYGINQYNGSGLLPTLDENLDRIAYIDPLFLQQGFAYYANKQHQDSHHPQIVFPGKRLLYADEISRFQKECPANQEAMLYIPGEKSGDITISSPLSTSLYHHLYLLLNRDTFYLLNAAGDVIGFAYLYIDFDSPKNPAPIMIKGYVKEQKITYLAEVDGPQVSCLLSFPADNQHPR